MSTVPLITQLLPNHVPQVSQLHFKRTPKTELSVKLGQRFISSFYSCIAQSSYARGFVALLSDEVVAYVCAFSNYLKFNNIFLRQYLGSISVSAFDALINQRIAFNEILALMTDNRKLSVLHEPEYHLGALAASESLRRQINIHPVMCRLIKEAHLYLIDCGARYAWGSANALNRPVQFLLRRCGYSEVDTIAYGRESIKIFEIMF